MSQARACATARPFPITPQLPSSADDTCDALWARYVVAVAGGGALGMDIAVCYRGRLEGRVRCYRVLRRPVRECRRREVFHGELRGPVSNWRWGVAT